METLWEKKQRIRKRILAYKRERFEELNFRQYLRQGGDEVEEKEIETVTARQNLKRDVMSGEEVGYETV